MLFQQDFTARPSPISVNEKIRFASTFHAVCAMAIELAPNLCGSETRDFGIESVNYGNFYILCKHTYTGIQFIVVCDSNVARKTATDLLNQIYVLYADYVLKNPFYHTDMPIRLAGFNRGLKQLVLSFAYQLFFFRSSYSFQKVDIVERTQKILINYHY
jgi:hypothetical protein